MKSPTVFGVMTLMMMRMERQASGDGAAY